MHGDDCTWIQTFTGKQFWPLDPRPEDVCLEDIAHALALKCRYTGHCREFYSVAQHCVLGARAILDNLILIAKASSGKSQTHWGLESTSRNFAIRFMLHDSAEAYLFDVASPVKDSQELCSIIEIIESRILNAIFKHFNIKFSWEGIKPIDLSMTMTEKRDLMAMPVRPWRLRTEPFSFIIEPWSWQKSEYEYLKLANELGIK